MNRQSLALFLLIRPIFFEHFFLHYFDLFTFFLLLDLVNEKSRCRNKVGTVTKLTIISIKRPKLVCLRFQLYVHSCNLISMCINGNDVPIELNEYKM